MSAPVMVAFIKYQIFPLSLTALITVDDGRSDGSSMIKGKM